MSWHYQVRHRVDKGNHLYDMVERSYSVSGWITNSIAPIGETREELRTTLQQMLTDSEYYPVLEDVWSD